MQDNTGSIVRVKLINNDASCEAASGWTDMYLEFSCTKSASMNTAQFKSAGLAPTFFGSLDTNDYKSFYYIQIPPMPDGHTGETFKMDTPDSNFICPDTTSQYENDRWQDFTVTKVGFNEYDIRRCSYKCVPNDVDPCPQANERCMNEDDGHKASGWDYNHQIMCARDDWVDIYIGSSEDYNRGVSQLNVPAGFWCPGTVTKYNWAVAPNGEKYFYDDVFHIEQTWEGDLITSPSQLKVTRSDSPGAGWGMKLGFQCKVQKSDALNGAMCVRPTVGPNPGGRKVFTVPEGYYCPSTVSKENWMGGYNYGDSFTLIQNGQEVEVLRDGCGHNNAWGIPLQFDCCRADVCRCRTPAPVGPDWRDPQFFLQSNGYVCNDGTSGNCPSDQVCHAEYFKVGKEEEGCWDPVTYSG